MDKRHVYIWYSGATDVTGKALADALEIDGGKTPPNDDKLLVIGWGCKAKDYPKRDNVTYINHPSAIYKNRDKLCALKLMNDSGVAVPNFCASVDAIPDSEYPVIGRKKKHQGGKDFWLCLNKRMAKQAALEGAEYFQKYINNVHEYRIHVIKNEVVSVVEKTRQSNPRNSWTIQQKEKVMSHADKNNLTLSEETIDTVLKIISKNHKYADPIIKSNTRGWKFTNTIPVNPSIKDLAKTAVTVMGLDFGAVDCCIDSVHSNWVLEINTGPGLQGITFDTYKNKLNRIIDSEINKRRSQRPVPRPSFTPIFDAPTERPSVTTNKSQISKKASLKHKMALLNDLIDAADDREAGVLESLAFKVFQKGA